jgi:hypothetical protein
LLILKFGLFFQFSFSFHNMKIVNFHWENTRCVKIGTWKKKWKDPQFDEEEKEFLSDDWPSDFQEGFELPDGQLPPDFNSAEEWTYY